MRRFLHMCGTSYHPYGENVLKRLKLKINKNNNRNMKTTKIRQRMTMSDLAAHVEELKYNGLLDHDYVPDLSRIRIKGCFGNGKHNKC